MIVIPDASAITLIADLLLQIQPVYHLAVQPIPPGQAVTLAQLVEAAWPAYRPITVTSWTPALTESGRAVTTADPALWVRGAGGVASLVYGYWVTDTVGGPLLWVETRPQGPVAMTNPTDSIVVLPQLTLRADSFP